MTVFTFHRAISHMMSSLLYPLVTFILLVVCVSYWGATALYPYILCMHVCMLRVSVQPVEKTTLYMQVVLKGDSVICCVLSFTLQSFPQSRVWVLLKQMLIDIWPLQETQSTE